MYEFKIKLLHNEEHFFIIKTVAKFCAYSTIREIDIIGARLGSNGLIFPGNIPVNILEVNWIYYYYHPMLVN